MIKTEIFFPWKLKEAHLPISKKKHERWKKLCLLLDARKCHFGTNSNKY